MKNIKMKEMGSAVFNSMATVLTIAAMDHAVKDPEFQEKGIKYAIAAGVGTLIGFAGMQVVKHFKNNN